jgi:hypothetical protein
MSSTEKFLCSLLFLVVFGVLVLAVCDPTVRPQALDFAKIALGAILTAMPALMVANKPR